MGGRGGTEAKRLKEAESKATEAEKRVAALEKRAKAAEKRIEAAESKEEEFQDAEEGDEESEEDGCKQWQAFFDDLKRENKYLQKKIKEAKWTAMSEKCERTIEEHKVQMEALQNKIWSAQDPQEQLQKQAARSQRLMQKQPELLG